MTPTVLALADVRLFRKYILEQLCRSEHIDPVVAVLQEALVVRRGKPCGMQFRVRAFRLVRASAIWSAHEHRLLFYDGSGSRFAEVNLCESPMIQDMMNCAA